MKIVLIFSMEFIINGSIICLLFVWLLFPIKTNSKQSIFFNVHVLHTMHKYIVKKLLILFWEKSGLPFYNKQKILNKNQSQINWFTYLPF
jgi:hypothetical protein